MANSGIQVKPDTITFHNEFCKWSKKSRNKFGISSLSKRKRLDGKSSLNGTGQKSLALRKLRKRKLRSWLKSLNQTSRNSYFSTSTTLMRTTTTVRLVAYFCSSGVHHQGQRRLKIT